MGPGKAIAAVLRAAGVTTAGNRTLQAKKAIAGNGAKRRDAKPKTKAGGG